MFLRNFVTCVDCVTATVMMQNIPSPDYSFIVHLPSSRPPQPLATTNLFSTSIILSCQGCHMNGTIQCVTFCMGKGLFLRSMFGVPGWPSWLSIWLWLRSWSQGSWFKSCIGPCADRSESGTCFGFCVSLSLPLPHSHSVSLCLSKINKSLKKFFLNNNKTPGKKKVWPWGRSQESPLACS